MLRFARFRRRRDEGGAAAVEFALVMLPLLWILFGLIQYGWYFYAMQTGTSAVGDAVRKVTVGDCQSDADLQTFITNRLGAAKSGSTAVSVTRTYKKLNAAGDAFEDDSAPGTIGGKVTIEVTFQTLNMHFPLIPVPNGGQVERQSTGRMEDTEASGVPCS